MKPTVAAIPVTRADDLSRVREAITAARTAGADRIELWLFGVSHDRYRTAPADILLTVEDDAIPTAERYATPLAAMMTERACALLLLPAGILENALAVRTAWLLGAGCATAITGIAARNPGFAVIRRTFGMQIEAEIVFEKHSCIFTVAKDSFDAATDDGEPVVVSSPLELPSNLDWFVDFEETSDTEEKTLSSSSLVLAGGRGLGGREAAENLDRLGERMHAGVGATRPVVLNAWLPMNRMVGVSGISVAPKLCIAFGVSGSIPFLKGVEKSEVLIAINSDPDAIIFRHCDVGLVGDCTRVLASLLEKTAGEPDHG
ncbi:MAG: FAD-binding protein [Planctomycetaceae bacterium]|nr:FAD-binding protein [Planctomycetaceae bacterium]